MADIADVLDALQVMCYGAIFPANVIIPAMTGKIVNIGQGWPDAGAVNDAMGKGQTLVSIIAIPSSTSKQPVPLSPSGDGVVIKPVHGMVATSTPTTISIVGNPNAGEYIAAIVGWRAYTYLTVTNDTAATVTAALAALIPGASVVANQVVTTTGAAIKAVRVGAPGVGGQIIDRQTQNVRISVWAPSPSDRNAVGIPIDLAVKRNVTVQYADTSFGINNAQGTDFIDKYQDELAFRRDLVVKCQWDTVDTYPVYEVTVFSVTQNPGPASKTSNY